MSTVNRRRHLFSVFVGHLAKDVTKTDLYNLFSECGQPYDIYVAENVDASPYNYGFVRFTTKQSCVKAVQELNQWSFHGNPLIVDLAKDTKDRIKIDTDHSQNEDGMCSQKEKPSSYHRANFSDLMRLGHLKESFIEEIAQVKTENEAPGTKLSHLLDDICETKAAFANTLEGHLINDDVSLKSIGQRFLSDEFENDGISANVSIDFFSALEDIMSTINKFVASGKDKPLVSCKTNPEITAKSSSTAEEMKLKNRTSVSDDSASLFVIGSRIHTPAAPTCASFVTDGVSGSKVKRKSVADDDSFSVKPTTDASLKSESITSQSFNDDFKVIKHVLNQSSVETVNFLTAHQSQESLSSGKMSSRLNDANLMKFASRCLPSGYEAAASNCVNSESSDSDCQNGDSGVDTDSLLVNCSSSSPTELSLVRAVDQNEACQSNAESSSCVQEPVSAIEMYLKKVAIGRGKLRSLGCPT